jgi:hypothetical protein
MTGGVPVHPDKEDKGRCIMKAGILFTGSGPILILTTYEAFDDPKLIEKLMAKRIRKYIAYEVPEEVVQDKYGMHYKVILGDLKQSDDLRILDYDGHHIFKTFSLKDLQSPMFHEPAGD